MALRLRAAQRWCGEAFDWLRASLSLRRSWILSKHRGVDSLENAKRVAVFVIWDRNSLVHDFVLQHLRGLKGAGFATIVVVNSPKLGAESIARLEPLCALIAHRRNKGYDFGGYHDGLRLIPEIEQRDGVLLINDSTYGPVFDLKSAVFGRLISGDADIWGLTDSWQHKYHLQSYFLYATRAAIASPAWKKFWRRFRHINNKRMIIARYEIGLTQTLMRGGLACRALYPYRELASEYLGVFENFKSTEEKQYSANEIAALRHIYDGIRNGNPMNGSHFMWDRLLVVHRCPYIKRELLTHNPTGVPLVGLWEVALKEHCEYDVTMIDRHLQMIARDRSP